MQNLLVILAANIIFVDRRRGWTVQVMPVVEGQAVEAAPDCFLVFLLLFSTP